MKMNIKKKLWNDLNMKLKQRKVTKRNRPHWQSHICGPVNLVTASEIETAR